MVHEAKRRGALTELTESDMIKNKYVESRKSNLDVFKDWLLLELNLSDAGKYENIEHWLCGDGYMREMQEKPAKKGEYNNKTTDDVWEKYLEYVGTENDINKITFLRDFNASLDASIKTIRTSTMIGGKKINLTYYYM